MPFGSASSTKRPIFLRKDEPILWLTECQFIFKESVYKANYHAPVRQGVGRDEKPRFPGSIEIATCPTGAGLHVSGASNFKGDSCILRRPVDFCVARSAGNGICAFGLVQRIVCHLNQPKAVWRFNSIPRDGSVTFFKASGPTSVSYGEVEQANSLAILGVR